MADIQTYSPRKVTDQNRDLLPSTHDPKKRTTYVQITLNEPEIKEAIRNYIRAQVPVTSGDELPVKIIAGRGENGHSAEITVSAGEVTVISPGRPVAALATFEEVAADAARRNNEDPAEEVESDPVEDIDKSVFESKAATLVAGETSPEPKAAPVKKSSLFDSVTPKSTEAAEAAIAAAAPPQTEHSNPVEDLPEEKAETPASPKPKSKSIFDV